MDSAPARHGQGGTGPAGGSTGTTAVRRSVTAIHPPRGPRAYQARAAVRPRRVRRRDGVLPLLTADALAVVLTAAAVPGLGLQGGAAGLIAVFLAALHAQAGLYRPRLAPSALLELPALAGRAAALWCGAAAVVAAVRPDVAMGWGVLLSAICLQVVLACAGRGSVNRLRRRSAVRRPCSALVVGPGEGASAVAAALHGRREYGLRPVGIADTGSTADGDGGQVPVLATHEDIRRAVIQNSVRHAVFTRPPEADERTASLVRLFHDHGCRLWLADPAGTAKVTGMRVAQPADQLWGYAVQPLLPRPVRPLERLAKRVIDGVLAAVALIAAAPVMGVCALAVRLSDGPGVIFRQERVGLYGRPFTLLKFRTLRADEHESATRWTVAGDNGMSPVGSFLRKSSLDELPQLWNVVRGDMSLVGPRPERPFFVAKFSSVHPGYDARHRMPVGITGLAQINGLRGDTSIEDRARFDNHYIDTWSLWQDLWILARTAASFFRFRLGGS
ncbi:exopolysaccharide biosynthesis polyprenyl glycosylphosphotransferase [Streptomyces sp. ISL-87]|nr:MULTISPECIES: exopolysaccharide biosynthesis polyprenyl glycosylphosphotransferase [unclassified Streptomyces]MBT2406378.1 exopolysaccharide biosynthesis polyprenyl glycosylphosphotransferase [Streptomyces sp. ISL-21]MBT2458438.1 exopolysaccharide biosynthesis polyprenyl glycosylphosphotransferase [Streptomyces sp. ISL-86]MBT2607526.1 exopolysaccharide biosynthesis polyprenyl glycosylphosphotransferase [Streptomyces sp. ISL-87]